MISVWCESKLLTADWLCIELCGDDEFKTAIEGQVCPDYEKLRLCTGKSNA